MNVYNIYFSPTGGTKKTAEILLSGMFDSSVQAVEIDLTDSQKDFDSVVLNEDDIAVIAVPSYGGRVPKTAALRLSQLRGNGARAVLVCVYGNRAYEDTLAEFFDITEQTGFCTVGAVAAVAEHSIVHEYGAGRPDAKDQEQLLAFAEEIQRKLESNDRTQPQIPGNRPYKEWGGSSLVPMPSEKCSDCGACAAKCPVQAIDRENPRKVDTERCISCMRCISVCPRKARKIEPAMLEKLSAALQKVCSVRKENERYL